MPEVLLDQPPGQGGCQQRLARAHGVDAVDQPVGRRGLEQEARRSGVEGVVDVAVEVVGGQHEHLGRRPRPGELAGRLDAVHHGHPDVHQGHVRLGASYDVEGLATVGRRTDDLTAAGLQHQLQPGPDDLLVVDDHDSRHVPAPAQWEGDLERERVPLRTAVHAAAEELHALGHAAKPQSRAAPVGCARPGWCR